MNGSFRATLLIGAPERLAIDGDDVGTELRERGDPGDEAVLESFRIERGEQVTEDRKSTRLNSSHIQKSRMPSSA